MDKGKRSDLLAAGRKKLRQFRQKKDQKGGNKDDQSSSKGSKMENDVHTDELTKREPEPATSTSTVDSDTLITTDSLDSSVTINNVDVLSVDSALVIGQGAPDDDRDPEGMPTESPFVNEDSLSPLEVDHEEARPPGLEQYKDNSGVGIQEMRSSMDEDSGSIRAVSNDSDRANKEATTAEPISGREASPDQVGFSSLSGERNEDEGNTSVDPMTQLLGIKSGEEDHETEKSDMHSDLAASGNVVEKALEASAFPSPAEVTQDFVPGVCHEHEDMQTQGSRDNNTLLEDSLEVDSAPEKEEVSLVTDGEISDIFFAEKSTQQIVSGDGVHVESSSSGKLPEVMSLSSWDCSKGLVEEKYSPISGQADHVTSTCMCYMPRRVQNDSGFADALEGFRKHLYLSYISKDFLRFLLDEQTELNDEICKQSSNEISQLHALLQETQKNNAFANEELEDCRSELQALRAAKEELQIRLHSREREFEVLNKDLLELQGNFKVSQQELVHLSAELAVCRDSCETLQKENANITTSLALEIDAGKKHLKEKEFLYGENEKLASDMLEHKERLSSAIVKQNQLESIIKETRSYFEQFAEDNLYLSSSLVVHKTKLKELEDEHPNPSILTKEAKFNINDHHVEGIAPDDATADLQSKNGIPPVSRQSQNPLFQNVDNGQPDSSFILEVLKGHLHEAKSILQNLEKSIEGIQFHSVSLRWSDGRGGTSGVSKLIQAFEPKQNSEPNKELQMSKAGEPDVLYELTKEQTSCLRETIEQIELEIGRAGVHIGDIWDSRTISKDFQINSQVLNQEIYSLQAKIDELIDEASNFPLKVQHLENQFDEIEQVARNQMGKFSSEVEFFQNGINNNFSILNQEKESLMNVISRVTEKLSKYSALAISDNFDIASRAIASVDAVTKSFDSLQERLEAANLDYNSLFDSYNAQNKLLISVSERKEYSTCQMHKMYTSLSELLNEACENIGISDEDVSAEENLQLIPEYFEKLITCLRELLDERVLFLSNSNNLELVLLKKNEEIQDLNMKYDASMKKLDDLQSATNELDSTLRNKNIVFEEASRRCFSLAGKLHYHGSNKDLCSLSMLDGRDEGTEASNSINNDFFSSFLQLEALVGLYIQEHERTVEYINLSKKYLLEVNIIPEISDYDWSLPLPALLSEEFLPKVREVQEQLDSLCVSYIKNEIELQFFKDYGNRTRDSLEATHSEFLLKMSELEQSEQKLSSVREKLSIAVTKGKGLIVQRDNLKQSLMEKSSELDMCLCELQSKEALLQEAEAKLKTYAEVDRIEALESELSYIRNSATALRDSFLLKDSVLQRIEEVLEDLDLPEYFHSKDIVEKVEMLCKMVAGNSSVTMTDWAQKSSVGVSHSDMGMLLTDSWRDDSQAISNPGFDDLKSKYEQLEKKFYGLAEHNDMLEQSLVERNSRVQKWEEVLDKIDMPPQLRTLEPEDKIERLGNMLYEVQQERDALQLSLKNLEASSDMLAVDLEESYRKLSEVSAEVAVMRSEKGLLSEDMKKLKFEYLELSEKHSQYDIDRNHFQREISEMQEKLAAKVQENLHFRYMENEISRLLDLTGSAFDESDHAAVLSDGNAIAHLEGLLRRLVDEHKILISEKSVSKDTEEITSGESNMAINGISGAGDADKEKEFNIMKLELDKATSNLNLAMEERNEFMEKYPSLMLEKEAIGRQKKLLEEEITVESEKSKSLLSQLDVVLKEKDALQTQLTIEEEKSASVRDKLNIAVRKGKGLVQQRDVLKQEIEGLNTMMAQLKSENIQRVESLESEKIMLMNQLGDSEQNLKHSTETLSRLLRILDSIDIGKEIHEIDPVEKLEEIGKLNSNLHSSLISAEQEAKKSKRAAELLLAELNEVQERTDILQEELGKAEAAFLDISNQKNIADSARTDALCRLEEISIIHYEEIKKQNDNLVELTSGIGQIKNNFSDISGLLVNAFMRDADLLGYMVASTESIEKEINCEILDDPPLNNSLNEENLNSTRTLSEVGSCKIPEEYSTTGNLTPVQCVLECLSECGELKTKIHKHSILFNEQVTRLLKSMELIKRKFSSQKEESEFLKEEVAKLESTIRSKESEIYSVKRNLSFLYQTCSNFITEIEKGDSQISDNNKASLGGQSVTESAKLPSEIYEKVYVAGSSPLLTDDVIRSLADKLFLIAKGTRSNETTELKTTILELQRELQEKDAYTSTISAELVSQIRVAEAVAKRSFTELESAKSSICSLEKQVEALEKDNELLESRVTKLRDMDALLDELKGKVKSLSDALTAKEQEIDTLMEALDEEEAQVQELENRNKELNNIVENRNIILENLEANHEKTVTKLSATVNRFDELYNLSENLLAEVENLQSQLQSQESEISFFRQEVTRCTDELLASQESNKKYSSEMYELIKWFDTMISRFGLTMDLQNADHSQILAYTEILDKSIPSIMDELSDLRIKVSQQMRTLPGPSETEQMKTEPVSAGIVKHMRGGRRINNDQIAIAIDTEKDESAIDDEDDDKSHGFKSLTMSRFVPRVSRPIVDKIDGMWVSGDRLLMRQPALRLGLLVYWIALHALLASLI